MARSLFTSLSRRELLQLGAIASASPLRASTGKRVIIVGAGFGGLACGYELRKSGFDVTVLEARDRIGGRVVTFRDLAPGHTVEGGGELIGSNHPTWLAYARQFGFKLIPAGGDEAAVWLDGKLLGSAETRRLYDEMNVGIARINADAKDVVADTPWTSPHARRLDLQNLGERIESFHIGRLGTAGLLTQFTGNMGLDPKRGSYLGVLAIVKGHGVERYWTDSEAYRCVGGNQQLAAKLVEGIGADRVHLQSPVTAIEVRERGVKVTAAGRAFEGDAVVLAIPPSVWRSVKIDPPLPAVLQPQMGVNTKYLAAVRERYAKHADTMSDGETGMTWEATAGQSGKGAALVSFAGGAVAESLHGMAPAERTRALRRDMERVLPGFAANFAADRFMDWPGDPYTRAGYCFPAPGQITACGPILREGLGRLHFAGEHASFRFMGFMEGGLESGVSLARRMAHQVTAS